MLNLVSFLTLQKFCHAVSTFEHHELMPAADAAKSLQSCPTLCDPMDSSPPGSSVHGILQARILEWVAISFSRGSSQPRDGTCISCISCIGKRILYYKHHLGSQQLRMAGSKRKPNSVLTHKAGRRVFVPYNL